MANEKSKTNSAVEDSVKKVEEAIKADKNTTADTNAQDSIIASMTETPVAAVKATPKLVTTPVPKTPEEETAAQILAALDAYKEAMAPGKYVNPVQGAREQVKLYRIIDRIVNHAVGRGFWASMDVLMKWFDDNSKGVASDTHLFRFSAEWAAGQDEFNAFTRLGSMFITLCNRNTRRENLKHFNFDYYLQYKLTDNARNSIIEYFNN